MSGNTAHYGGGIDADVTSLSNCTVAGNRPYASGGAIHAIALTLANSTITGNSIHNYFGAGIKTRSLETSNSMVTGNFYRNDPTSIHPDDVITNSITSNGHNIFGSFSEISSFVIPGDRVDIAASNLFAAIDPATGGGRLNADGIVPLRDSPWNSALSAGESVGGAADRPARQPAAGAGGRHARHRCRGAEPAPVLDRPQQRHRRHHRHRRGRHVSALKLHDLVHGLGGDDTLNGNDGADRLEGGSGRDWLDGGDGSDLLIGGSGNDRLIGGLAVDLASFAGSTAVVVDLSGATDKATRGSEVDTLLGVEGAIGSSAADTFRGDALANSFRGGLARTSSPAAGSATSMISTAWPTARTAAPGAT